MWGRYTAPDLQLKTIRIIRRVLLEGRGTLVIDSWGFPLPRGALHIWREPRQGPSRELPALLIGSLTLYIRCLQVLVPRMQAV